MARPKKQVQAKEPVTLRFKELSKGNKSLYLDIYRDGVRTYEFLKLYLIPERPGIAADKIANQITLDAANAIKAQRIKEIITGEAGIKDYPGKNLLLLDWMQQRQDRAAKAARDAGRKANNTALAIGSLAAHLRRYIDAEYKGKAITLGQVNKAFCIGFAAYLTKGVKRYGGRLSQNTTAYYYNAFETAINEAHKKGLISSNPAALVESIEKPQSQPAERDYLTAEELKALAATKCLNEQVKAAFLFSCFCGLRISDIEGLTWNSVHQDGDAWRIETRMEKTRKMLYLPLSDAALKCMPERGEKAGDALVFDLPKRRTLIYDIKAWVKRAGINKRISFHCARHTFATLALTKGADLYSVSKLLGHASVTTTQVYAAIVDQRKKDTANLLNGILD